MQFPRVLAAAAMAAATSTAAHAAIGSGHVQFSFTGFEGPFAAATAANVGDPSAWFLHGAVDGQTPTINGKVTDGDFGNRYIGGTLPISGQSVSMVYTDLLGAVESVVSFTPVASFPMVSTGEAFKLGTLSYTNGQWVGGSSNPANNYPVTLSFTLSTTSSTPAFNQTVNDALVVVTNQSSGLCDTLQDQMNEADFVFIRGAPRLGSGRVFDANCAPPGASNTGTVELWGAFGSLDYVSFRNPTGSLFIADSTAVGPIGGGVPEPSAWALLIAGLGAVGAALRRSRRGAVPVHA